MDLVTQGILGASVAQVGFQKTLGRRALVWGALVGMLPDLDVIVKLSPNPFAEILYHRGVTHSLWFGPVIGPLLGYLLFLFYKKQGRNEPLSSWIGLCIWCLLTHPLLDVFTVYGTQLLAPFSSHRFTFPAIAIVDPVYSLTLLGSLLIGILFPRKRTLVTISAAIALVLSSAYIVWGLEQNEKAQALSLESLKQENKEFNATIQAYPTLFQLFLRRLVVEDDQTIRVGYVSTWSPKPIKWVIHQKPKNLPSRTFLADPEVMIFRWFSGDQLALFYDEPTHKVTLLDTRYGFQGRSLFGIWGISFLINENGEKIGLAKKDNVSLDDVSAQTIVRLLQETFV